MLKFDPVLHVDRVTAIFHLDVFVLCAANRANTRGYPRTRELHAFDMVKLV